MKFKWDTSGFKDADHDLLAKIYLRKHALVAIIGGYKP